MVLATLEPRKGPAPRRHIGFRLAVVINLLVTLGVGIGPAPLIGGAFGTHALLGIDIASTPIWRAFTPFTEENKNYTNRPTPEGISRVCVTLVGGGGSGGAGVANLTQARGGGGGGGGGAYIPRICIPAELLGSTYTVTTGVGGAAVIAASNTGTIYHGIAGSASRFTSGSISLVAPGGGRGPGGGTASVQDAPAIVTPTLTGISGPSYPGGAGTDSGAAISPNGDSPPGNTNGTGGGGMGGSIDSTGVLYGSGGRGGSGKAGAGGAGGARSGNTSTSPGKPGVDWNGSGTVLPGSGGGGAGVRSGYGSSPGGEGGYPGGGGGGSSGTNGAASYSGAGGAGHTLLEWE